MAKSSGLGNRLWVGTSDLSGDTQKIEIASPLATLDVTSIDKGAYERIGGIRGGEVKATMYFDPSVSHPVLSALPTADVQLTYVASAVSGAVIGDSAASMVCRQIGYDGSRGEDGMFTLDVEALSDSYGIEWGRLLTPGLRTDTAATNGSSLDGLASTAHGGQAYLHVTAFTGTDATITIEHSANNSTWATLGTFASVTAAGVQRVAVAAGTTVNRYLRVASATTGGFTSTTFGAVFCRNETATRF
jgi:hypothetical protein